MGDLPTPGADQSPADLHAMQFEWLPEAVASARLLTPTLTLTLALTRTTLTPNLPLPLPLPLPLTLTLPQPYP